MLHLTICGNKVRQFTILCTVFQINTYISCFNCKSVKQIDTTRTSVKAMEKEGKLSYTKYKKRNISNSFEPVSTMRG